MGGAQLIKIKGFEISNIYMYSILDDVEYAAVSTTRLSRASVAVFFFFLCSSRRGINYLLNLIKLSTSLDTSI